MATFKTCVFKHQKRIDGKFPVTIRLTLKGSQVYLKTDYYVTEKQLDEKFILKDKYLVRLLNQKIELYEDLIIKKLGDRIELYSVGELKDFLLRVSKPGSDESIDFVEFSKKHIEKIKPKQKSRASVLQRTLNSFTEFSKHDKIPISNITSRTLRDFEAYLYSPRTIKRLNQHGKAITYEKQACISSGVHDYMGNLRTLFNAAKKEYNNDDLGEIRISHNPFTNYEIPKKKNTRHRNLDAPTIRKIINCPDTSINGSHGRNRANLARDCFALSFFLVGMNTVDLYNISEYKEGRITYNRSKTKDKRVDDALISIKVESEILPLFSKYRDKSGKRVFCFYQMYNTIENFNSAVNKGLKQVASALELDIPLSSYYARHSWGTIAWNDLDISEDVIHKALNHAKEEMKMTNIYIAKSWEKIDIANRELIDFINSDCKDGKAWKERKIKKSVI